MAWSHSASSMVKNLNVLQGRAKVAYALTRVRDWLHVERFSVSVSCWVQCQAVSLGSTWIDSSITLKRIKQDKFWQRAGLLFSLFQS